MDPFVTWNSLIGVTEAGDVREDERDPVYHFEGLSLIG